MTALSIAQQGIWVTENTVDAGSGYHLALAVRFDGDLRVPALLDAAATVLRRHPALYGHVAGQDGRIRLVPGADPPPVTRVAALPEELDGVLRAAVTRPFDLREGPLARFTLVTSGPATHVLLFVAHHLVFDGMSKDVVLRELAEAYATGSVAAPPASDEPAPEPTDRDRAAAFWADRWREPEAPVLPAGAGVTVGTSVAVTATWAGPDREVTRFEWLLTALHALLWRYGNADPVVSIDLSTRTAALADAVGLYVNELPVRVAVSPDETLGELAARIRVELRNVYAVRDVPLAHAVRGLTPRTALTPVSLSYRRTGPAPVFPGVAASVDWALFPGTARNALHVQAVDTDGRLTLSLHVDPGLVEAGRVLTHLRAVLDAPSATRLADLPVPPADERALVLETWNDTGCAVPDGTVVDWFRAQATATPEATAIEDGDRRLSYAELAMASDRLAGRLAAQGVRPGDVVGLHLGRSVDLVVAVLGVLAAGAAYLPLDPEYPVERLEFLATDAGTTLVVGADLLGAGPTAPPVAPGPDDLAYVLYTSGSTGRPKGVEVTHRSLANLLYAAGETLDTGPGDAWLGLTALSFDISVVELLLPLVRGGRVVVVPDRLRRDPAAQVALVRTRGVTHVQATPSGWRMLLDAGFAEPSVLAVAGGEALAVPLAAALRSRTRRLVNGYGPTEATVYALFADVAPDPATVTVGRPPANTRAYVLDPAMRPVPVGIPGELYLGGTGVARGYRGRPGLTADRFVPDPFGPPGARLYRTGDRVRHTATGELEFLGRWDNQVKLRGYRIELGEVEAHLLAQQGVAHAAVVLRDDALVGYVAPATLDPAALRADLAARVPAHLVPATVVVLDALPLTGSGKVDRTALPEPPRAAAEPRTAADDPLVAAVREIWQDVLRVDDIDVDEDLFDLGGHSLTIMQISSRIRKRLGVDLAIDVFFDSPTVAGVAAAIAERE